MISSVVILTLALIPSLSYHIGYTVDEQRQWHELHDDYSKCGFGMYQTPIHIEHHRIEPIVMPALDFKGYHNFLEPPLTIHNNGHTVELSCGEPSAMSVSGGFLTSSYNFLRLHFHWGRNNSEGSEHMLNNVRYPMEMHLVHRNVAYNSTEEALQHSDGLVVLGFFFQVQLRDNNKLREIARNLRHITNPSVTTPLKRTFSLATILPKKLEEFFTYQGSLTTPPCSEVVTWFIFPEPIPISFLQMSEFRKLSIQENYRELQEAGQRKIYLRVAERFMKLEELPSSHTSPSYRWAY